MALNLRQVLPLLLMVSTNLATLHTLSKHIRTVTAGVEGGAAHVNTERKAGHVILALVSLFVVCWVMQMAAVTYYNYDGGVYTQGLLTVSQFSASLFVGFSPMVVALGHGKMRKKIAGMMQAVMKKVQCRDVSPSGKQKGVLETISYKQTFRDRQDASTKETHTRDSNG